MMTAHTAQTLAAPPPLAPAGPVPGGTALDGAPAAAGRPAEALRRRELGAFLRGRRERIVPQQVGLTPVGRRRTPGLRREELAQLAGVGVTWYTWLEQGRDINVSPQVLEAICRTLMLDPHERAHVMTLAGLTNASLASDCKGIQPPVQAMLDALGPVPAVVLNPRFDMLAWNRSYGRMITDLDALPLDERNALWLAFTHPVWRRALADWDQQSRRLVALYRLAMADHVAEPCWKALVARLASTSPEFARAWAENEVLAPENRLKLVDSPRAGLLRFDATNYWLGPGPGSRLLVYTPADEQTRKRLEKLAADL